MNGPDLEDHLGTDSPIRYELNLAGSIAPRFLYAQHTAGMVWFMEDDAIARNQNSPFNPVTLRNNSFAIPVTLVHDMHRINGRGVQTSEDLFTLQMDDTNAVDLARPSAAHVEGVNMAFADGATRFVTESVDYRAYQAVMTPRGKSSDVPFPEFTLSEEIGQ